MGLGAHSPSKYGRMFVFTTMLNSVTVVYVASSKTISCAAPVPIDQQTGTGLRPGSWESLSSKREYLEIHFTTTIVFIIFVLLKVP